MPDRIRRATLRPRAVSRVKTAADRPYSLSLASADRVLLVARADDRDDRAEALVAVEVHLGGDAVDHGRAHQHAVRLAAGQRASRPWRARRRSGALTCSTVLRSTTAPSGVLPSRGSPQAIAAALVRELLGERVGDRVDDDDPLGRHADLALVHERAERGGLDRLVEVGILEHDQRRLAAEFEQAPA